MTGNEGKGGRSLPRAWPWLALPCLLATCTALAATAAGDSSEHGRSFQSGTVERVVDGDTVELRIGAHRARVHLHGVEAPERDQPWGKRSMQALGDLVLGQSVDLEYSARDPSMRDGAVMFVGEEEVGAAMVRDGHAWADRAHLGQRDEELCELEAEARAARRGLWSQPQQQWVAPWEYRHRLFRSRYTDYSQETAEQCAAALRRKHQPG